MKPEHVATFEQHSSNLGAAVDALIAEADTVRDHAEEIRRQLAFCHRAVATLRRTEDDPQMMGRLNSLSAAHARHLSLEGSVIALEAALSSLENAARDLRLLHPSVVAALHEKIPPALLPPEAAS
jgi:hypothetical protein